MVWATAAGSALGFTVKLRACVAPLGGSGLAGGEGTAAGDESEPQPARKRAAARKRIRGTSVETPQPVEGNAAPNS